ncbi:MAG: hypothetical protein IKM61_05970 [Eubacteriaceae bacterium]|nr:hypothetical protein [Eubacteriaceae bacterium]
MFLFFTIFLFYLFHLFHLPKRKKIKPALNLYFGLPGSGKSTYAAALVNGCLRAGIPVYCNFPVKGTYQFDPVSDLGRANLHDCVMIIDEAGLCFNNRNYAKFSQNNLEFFKLHRHYNVEIHVFSQGINDADIKIRQLAQKIFFLEKTIFPYFCRIRRIRRFLGVDENGQLIDKYGFVLFSKKFVCLPRYWNMFDSFIKPMKLIEETFKYIEPVAKLPIWRRIDCITIAQVEAHTLGLPLANYVCEPLDTLVGHKLRSQK